MTLRATDWTRRLPTDFRSVAPLLLDLDASIAVGDGSIADSSLSDAPTGTDILNGDGAFAAATNFEEVGDGEWSVSGGQLHIEAASANSPPTITSSAGLTAPENGTAIATLTATDPDEGDVLTWTIVGGTDQAKFNLTTGGVLTFLAAKNYESPDDANADGVYLVTVRVTDVLGDYDEQAFTVTLTNVNEAPIVTVAGGTMWTPQNVAATLSPFSVADVDTGTMSITLSATNGTLSLSGTAGLTFTLGDGIADSSMAFSGSTANVNAALASLVFNPTTDFAGTAVLSIVCSDGSLSDNDSKNVEVRTDAIFDIDLNSLSFNGTGSLTLYYNGNPATASFVEANVANASALLAVLEAASGAPTGVLTVTKPGATKFRVRYTGSTYGGRAQTAPSYSPDSLYKPNLGDGTASGGFTAYQPEVIGEYEVQRLTVPFGGNYAPWGMLLLSQTSVAGTTGVDEFRIDSGTNQIAFNAGQWATMLQPGDVVGVYESAAVARMFQINTVELNSGVVTATYSALISTGALSDSSTYNVQLLRGRRWRLGFDSVYSPWLRGQPHVSLMQAVVATHPAGSPFTDVEVTLFATGVYDLTWDVQEETPLVVIEEDTAVDSDAQTAGNVTGNVVYTAPAIGANPYWAISIPSGAVAGVFKIRINEGAESGTIAINDTVSTLINALADCLNTGSSVDLPTISPLDFVRLDTNGQQQVLGSYTYEFELVGLAPAYEIELGDTFDIYTNELVDEYANPVNPSVLFTDGATAVNGTLEIIYGLGAQGWIVFGEGGVWQGPTFRTGMTNEDLQTAFSDVLGVSVAVTEGEIGESVMVQVLDYDEWPYTFENGIQLDDALGSPTSKEVTATTEGEAAAAEAGAHLRVKPNNGAHVGYFRLIATDPATDGYFAYSAVSAAALEALVSGAGWDVNAAGIDAGYMQVTLDIPGDDPARDPEGVGLTAYLGTALSVTPSNYQTGGV